MHRSGVHSTTGCDSESAMHGGIFGQLFRDVPDNCRAVVKTIKIRSQIGIRITGIQLIYQLSNGHTMVGGYFGGSGGHLSTINLDINKPERIIAVLGRTDTSVRELTFFTNLGRVYGPYGGCTGDSFRLWSCHVRGIHGVYSSNQLNGIGFYCTTVVP